MEEPSAWSSELSEDDVLSIASTDSTVDSGITSPRGGFRVHDVRVTSSTSSVRLVSADAAASRTRGHRADVPEYLKASTRPSLNKLRSTESSSSSFHHSSTDRGSRPSLVDSKISLLSRKFEGQGDSVSPRSPLRKFNSSPSINDVGKPGAGAKLNVFQGSAAASNTLKQERRLDSTSSRFSQSQDRLDRLSKNETHSTSYVTKPRETGNQVGKVATLYLNKLDSGKLSSVGSGIGSPRAVELRRSSASASSSGSSAEHRTQPRRQLSEASFQDKLKKFQSSSFDSDQQLKSPRSPKSQVYIDKTPGVVNVKSTILRRDILEWNRFGAAKKPGQEVAEEAAAEEIEEDAHQASSSQEFRVRVPRSRNSSDRKVSEPVIGHVGPLKAIHPDERKVSEPSLRLERGHRPEHFQTLPNKPDLSPVLSPKAGSPRDPHPGFFTDSFDSTADRKGSLDFKEKTILTFQHNFNSAPKPFVTVEAGFDSRQPEPVIPVVANRNFNSQPKPFKKPEPEDPSGFGASDDYRPREAPVLVTSSHVQDRALSERFITLNSGRRPSQERVDSPRVEPNNPITPSYSSVAHTEFSVSQPRESVPANSGKPGKFQEVFLKFQVNEDSPQAKSEPGLTFLPSQSVGRVQQSNSITVTQPASSGRFRRQRSSETSSEEPSVGLTLDTQHSQTSQQAYQSNHPPETSHSLSSATHLRHVESDRDKPTSLRSFGKDRPVEARTASRQHDQVIALRDRSPGCADSDGSADSGVSSLGRSSSLEARSKEKFRGELSRPTLSIDRTKRVAEPDNVVTSAPKAKGGILDRISKLNSSVKTDFKSPHENASVTKDIKDDRDLSRRDNDIKVHVSVNNQRQDVLVNAENNSFEAQNLSQKSDDLSVELKNEYSKETIRVPKLDLGPLADSSDDTPTDIQPGRRRRTYSTESDSTVKSENTIESIESLQTDPEGHSQDPTGGTFPRRRRRQEPSVSVSVNSNGTETVGQRLRRRLDEITNATRKSAEEEEDPEPGQRDPAVYHRRRSSDDRSSAKSDDGQVEVESRIRERFRRGSAKSRDTTDTEGNLRESEAVDKSSDRNKLSTSVNAGDETVIKETISERYRSRNVDRSNKAGGVVEIKSKREIIQFTSTGDSDSVEERVLEKQTVPRRRHQDTSSILGDQKAAPEEDLVKERVVSKVSAVPDRSDQYSERPVGGRTRLRDTTSPEPEHKKTNPERNFETRKEDAKNTHSLLNGNVKEPETEPEPEPEPAKTKRRGLKSLKQISAFYDEILDDPFSASTKSGDESAKVDGQSGESAASRDVIYPKIGRDLNKEKSVNHVQEEYEETKVVIKRLRSTESSQKRPGLSYDSYKAEDVGSDLVKPDVCDGSEVRVRTREISTAANSSSSYERAHDEENSRGRVRRRSDHTSEEEELVDQISDEGVNAGDSDSDSDLPEDIGAEHKGVDIKKDIYEPDLQGNSESDASVHEDEVVASHREPREVRRLGSKGTALEADPDTEPEVDAEPEADSEPEADAEPEVDSEPEADAEPEADSEPEEALLSDDEQPAMFTRLRKRVEEVMSLNTDTSTSGKKPEFTRLMRDQTCVNGERVVFECRVEGEPRPSIRWTKDGEAIEEDQSDIVMSYKGEKVQLEIPEVLPEDEGEYICEATNTAGTASCSAALLVDEDDLLPEEPSERTRPASAEAEVSSEADSSEEEDELEVQGPSPRRRSPRGPSPRQRSPRGPSPRRRSPRGPSPRRRSSQDPSPRQRSPRGPSPRRRSPQDPSPVPAVEDDDILLPESISDVIHDGDDEHSEAGDDSNLQRRPRRRRCRPAESEEEEEEDDLEDAPEPITTQRRRRPEEQSTVTPQDSARSERFRAPSPAMSAKGRRPTKPSFIIKPRRQFVDEGQTAKFKASFDGEPPPEIVWDKDGEPLEHSSKYNLYENDDFHFLEVLEVGDSDKGCYTCTIKNDLGKETHSANLEVYAKLGTRWKTKNPPKVERGLTDKTASDGERCVLDCVITGVPEPTVTWYYDGKLIKPSDGIKQQYSGSTAKLVFHEVFVDDNGTYECVAKNTNGEVRTKAKLTVKAPASEAVLAPAFLTTPQGQTVNDGDKVTIECKVKGSPAPKVTWYKGQKAVKSSRDFKPQFDGTIARLDILEVYPEDAAEYTCVARNSAGEARVKCKIVVKETDANQNNIKTSGRSIVEKTTSSSVQSTKDKSKDSPAPASVTKIATKTVTTKTSAVLSSASKMPASQPVEPARKSETTSRVISSKTESVRSESRAKSATPSPPAKKESPVVETMDSKSPPPVVAPKTKRISRTVGPPQFVSRLEDVTALDGERVELMVEVQATGPIEVIWLHNDQEIKKTSTVYQMVSDGNVHRLVIPEVFPEDGGCYVCEVYNDIGDEDCQCTLTVEDRPPVNSPAPRKGDQVVEEAGDDYEGDDDEFFSPEFVKRPKGSLVDEGSSITFSCQVIANPMPRIIWEKDGQILTDTPGRFVVINDPEQDSYSLEIVHTLATDAGRYVVLASNAEGKAQCSVSLNVTAMDKGEVEDFRTLLKTRTKTKVAATVDRAHEADQVDFREVLSPKGVQTQVGKTFEAEQVDFRGVLANQGIVTKANTYKGYAGEQKDFRGLLGTTGPESPPPAAPEPTPVDVRQALNPSRSRRSAPDTPEKEPEQLDFRAVLTKHVQTKTRPKISKELYDIRVAEGERASLECHVTGVPPPKVRWYFNKKEIKESKYFKMSYDDSIAKLVIAEVYPEDDGEYMCRAVNESGTSFTSCDIHVQEFILESDDSHRDKPASSGDTMEPPFIEDLSPDNVQMVRGMDFQLKAKFVGEPTPTIVWLHDKTELVPDKRIKIDLVRDTSVLTVSDSSPDDSGRYTVVVENELGRDTCNSSVTIEDRPNPPSGEPAISTITGTSLTVSWYGPSYDGGSCITDYRVEVAPMSNMEWKTLTSSCKYTSFQAKGLASNTEYVFRISAGNKHGFSDPGKVSTPVVTIDHSHSCSKLDELSFEPRHVAVEEGRNFKDHYKVAEEIGKGRFGSVHKCVHKETNRTFAAKFIRVKPSERKETKHELSVMNELHHPKLLLLYDAFESPREMVLVLEHVAGGELFERIIDDDYILTERECIHFMRQICDAVLYMHDLNILHLDLKPENILCISRNSNEVKIIDFGLARKFDPKQSFRVMFGTPEFVAPEVVNYDQINFATDMWSVGVICYILLSGLSPFMGDNDAETLANVTGAQWDFEDDCFDEISENAKDFIEGLLAKNMRKRMSAANCLAHTWLSQDVKFMKAKRLSTDKHKRFMARRKWQKTGNAIRALGRMSLLQRTMTGERRSMNGDSDQATTITSGSIHSRQSSTASESEGSPLTVNRTRSPARSRRSKGEELTVAEACDSGIEVEGRGAASPRTGSADTNSFKSQVFLSFNSKTSSANAEEKPVRRRRSEQNGEQQHMTMPQFIKPMKNFEAFEGTTARFDVRISGDPSPDVTWLKDNQELRESDKYGFERSRGVCSLLIHDSGESDDASYQCVISNRAGSASSSAELYVEGAERPLPK